MKQQQDVSDLAERVRAVLPPRHAAEKRMFGGITFLVNGNMLCCVFRHGLMLRIGTAAEAAALAQPHVRRLSETRKMPGFVFIEPGGIAGKAALAQWLGLARAYVDPLPAKAAKKVGGRKTSGKSPTAKSPAARRKKR